MQFIKKAAAAKLFYLFIYLFFTLIYLLNTSKQHKAKRVVCYAIYGLYRYVPL